MSIRENIEARKASREIYDLALGESCRLTAEGQETFWRAIMNIISEKHTTPKPQQTILQEPMSNIEAKQFENETMDFGLYNGLKIKAIPWEYLDWLEAQPDIRRQLNRYLRSERAKHERLYDTRGITD